MSPCTDVHSHAPLIASEIDIRLIDCQNVSSRVIVALQSDTYVAIVFC